MVLGLSTGPLVGTILGSAILLANWCPAAAPGPANAADSSLGAPPTTGERSLERYGFHGGFLAGSLRTEIPLPLFDPDPEHLWNRLFAAFWVRPLIP